MNTKAAESLIHDQMPPPSEDPIILQRYAHPDGVHVREYCSHIELSYSEHGLLIRTAAGLYVREGFDDEICNTQKPNRPLEAIKFTERNFLRIYLNAPYNRGQVWEGIERKLVDIFTMFAGNAGVRLAW